MKYLFFSIALVMLFLHVNAQSGSYETDCKQIKNSIVNYLLATANNVYCYGPIGSEENGKCLPEKMNTRKMYNLADPLDEYVFYSQLGSDFYKAFYSFSLQNQDAFKPYESHENEKLHFDHDYVPCEKCYYNHVKEVGFNILHQYLSHEVAKPIERELDRNIHIMLHNTYHVSMDCQPTGLITMNVHNAALEGIETLNAISIRNPNSTIGRMRLILKHCYSELLDLPVQDKDAMLSAEWQIGYYAIIFATAKELKEMETPPSSTAYLDYAADKKYLRNTNYKVKW